MFSKEQQLQRNGRLREPTPKKVKQPKKVLPEKRERLRPPVETKRVRLREDVPKKTTRLREKPIFEVVHIKEKPFKSKAYLDWFHCQNFGCLVCGDNTIEAHHVLRGGDGRPDDTVVPLCPEHHNGKYSPHGFNSRQFGKDYPKDVLLEIASRLFNSYLEEQGTTMDLIAS